MFNYLTVCKIKRIIAGEELTKAKDAVLLSSYYYSIKVFRNMQLENAIKS